MARIPGDRFQAAWAAALADNPALAALLTGDHQTNPQARAAEEELRNIATISLVRERQQYSTGQKVTRHSHAVDADEFLRTQRRRPLHTNVKFSRKRPASGFRTVKHWRDEIIRKAKFKLKRQTLSRFQISRNTATANRRGRGARTIAQRIAQLKDPNSTASQRAGSKRNQLLANARYEYAVATSKPASTGGLHADSMRQAANHRRLTAVVRNPATQVVAPRPIELQKEFSTTSPVKARAQVENARQYRQRATALAQSSTKPQPSRMPRLKAQAGSGHSQKFGGPAGGIGLTNGPGPGNAA